VCLEFYHTLECSWDYECSIYASSADELGEVLRCSRKDGLSYGIWVLDEDDDDHGLHSHGSELLGLLEGLGSCLYSHQ
jgi:hypothetical protein